MFCCTGVERDEELLKGLLADDYCHVCEAVLLFESQRLSHYEVCVLLSRSCYAVDLTRSESFFFIVSPLFPTLQGKKHAQKVRVYLQAKRAEKMNKEATGSQVSTQFILCSFVKS